MDWATYQALKKSDPKYQEYRAQKLKTGLANAPKEARAFLAQMLQEILDIDEDMPLTLSKESATPEPTSAEETANPAPDNRED